jgi:hypothetical protein
VSPVNDLASRTSDRDRKPGDQYQVIVQINTKYRGSFNTIAFGEIKPYSGSLKDGRLDLVYYRNPRLNVADQFPLWT